MAVELSNSNMQKKALVVACYPWLWQHVLTIEVALHLLEQGYAVEYLDLSGFEKNLFKETARRVISRGKSQFLNELNNTGIVIRNPQITILVAKFKLWITKLAKVRVETISPQLWDIIYPGLVELTNDINASISNYPKLTKKLNAHASKFKSILEKDYKNHTDVKLAIIVNGRFPLNRIASKYFSEKKIEVQFVEFGANRNKFQIYEISPHSMKNRKELFEEFLINSTLPNNQVTKIGSEFFTKRKIFDSQANINWTRKMKWQEIPTFSNKKKICTYFPTSEKEFAGVKDAPKVGEFENQFEALNCLISNLGKDWDIYIRRHPQAFELSKDPEAQLWEKFLEMKNVHMIEPDSNIDSYALGMNSNMVAHFSSFIGPELIFAGHENVITLGPTQWESLDPNRHLKNHNDLRAFLRNPITSRTIPEITKLGYYMSNFGQDFRILKWNTKKEEWELIKN